MLPCFELFGHRNPENSTVVPGIIIQQTINKNIYAQTIKLTRIDLLIHCQFITLLLDDAESLRVQLLQQGENCSQDVVSVGRNGHLGLLLLLLMPIIVIIVTVSIGVSMRAGRSIGWSHPTTAIVIVGLQHVGHVL